MALTFRTPLFNEIEDEYYFLSRMLKEYPNYIHKIQADQEALALKMAEEEGEGDPEIEHSIYENFMAGYYEHDDVISYFYNAMALMIYSFYDRFVYKMAKQINIPGQNPGIRDIKNSLKITLSKEGQNASEELFNEFRPLRNYIAHNNIGSKGIYTAPKDDKQHLLALINQEKEIHFFSGIISISGPDYLSTILERAHALLREVALYLGGYAVVSHYEDRDYPHKLLGIHIGKYSVLGYKLDGNNGLVVTISANGKEEQRTFRYLFDKNNRPDRDATLSSFFIALNQEQ